MAITAAQKQALIDNLQLEITERARKLRAQYALQAQGLRTRLEMRVNRIPQAMRKRNIQDLLEEQTSKAKPMPPPPMPVQANGPTQVVAPQPQKTTKRKSDQMSSDENNNKENRPEPDQDELPVPKKRAKTAVKTTANTKAARTASRKVTAPSNVLSPRSNNSRTLIRSPFKTETARPTSPIKPSSTLGPAKSRAPSRQTGKRGAPAVQAHSEGRDSEASNTSAGTTIITKPVSKKAPVTKKTVSAKSAATTKGKPVAKKAPASAAASVQRVLRKRT